MARKSRYDQMVDAIKNRLHQLDHKNARTVEEAVAHELIICDAFGMKPSEAGAYDYCPDHPTTVRYRGQCQKCPAEEYVP